MGVGGDWGDFVAVTDCLRTSGNSNFGFDLSTPLPDDGGPMSGSTKICGSNIDSGGCCPGVEKDLRLEMGVPEPSPWAPSFWLGNRKLSVCKGQLNSVMGSKSEPVWESVSVILYVVFGRDCEYRRVEN